MKDALLPAVCVGFLCGLICFMGYASGTESESRRWQKECVKRGFAEYNQQTGVWQWKADLSSK